MTPCSSKRWSLHRSQYGSDLFDHGERVALTEEVLEAAKLRVLLGNPPGKPGSHGDAVNWESLLVVVPDEQDLVLVTDDKDFKSKLDPSRLNEYLIREWSRKKGSTIHLHGSLRSALEEHFADIVLAPEPEPEIDQAVQQLADAGNFIATHRGIRRLSRFSEFTDDQLAALIAIAEDNSQVRGIMQDDDVYEFYDSVARQYGKLMESSLYDRLADRLRDADTYRASVGN